MAGTDSGGRRQPPYETPVISEEISQPTRPGTTLWDGRQLPRVHPQPDPADEVMLVWDHSGAELVLRLEQEHERSGGTADTAAAAGGPLSGHDTEARSEAGPATQPAQSDFDDDTASLADLVNEPVCLVYDFDAAIRDGWDPSRSMAPYVSSEPYAEVMADMAVAAPGEEAPPETGDPSQTPTGETPRSKKSNKKKSSKRTKSMTPAALEANRANAQHSTGPKTPDGKARSARNAIRTGIYASAEPIMVGPFQEDPVQVQELVDGIVESLHPSNRAETEAALYYALEALRAQRFEKVATGVFALDTYISAEDRKGVKLPNPTPQRRRETAFTDLGVFLTSDGSLLGSSHERLARLVREVLDEANTTIAGRWDDTHQPADEAGWHDVMIILRDRIVADPDLADRVMTARAQSAVAYETVTCPLRQAASQRALDSGHLEKISALQTRGSKARLAALQEFAILKRLNSGETD